MTDFGNHGWSKKNGIRRCMILSIENFTKRQDVRKEIPVEDGYDAGEDDEEAAPDTDAEPVRIVELEEDGAVAH